MTARPYLTRRKHLKYPKGTRCMAERLNGGRTLRLTFEDGVAIDLRGTQFYLEGIETPDNIVWGP